MMKNNRWSLMATTALVAAHSAVHAQIGGGLIETTKVVFQQGLDGYDGTFEKRTGASGQDELGQDVQQYYLDGSFESNTQDDTVEMIRFDDIIGDGAGQIPENVTILRAELIFTTGTDGNAQSDGPYLVGRLGEAVDEDTIYTDLNDDNNPDDVPEMRGIRSIVTEQYAGYADIAQQEEVSAPVTEIVQAWVNGEDNFGFAVYANDTTNGWQIRTIGNDEVGFRPRLEVEYTTETIAIKEFKATRSAFVSTGNPTVDGSTLGRQFLDFSDTETLEALLQFGDAFGEDDAQIRDIDQIVYAELVIHTSGRPDGSTNADTDDPYTIHPILVDWDVASTFGPTGLSESATEIGASVGILNGMGENSIVSADVTAAVSAWKAGAANLGLDLRPVGTDGWQFYWPGFGEADLTPTLRVVTVEVLGVPEAAFSATPSEGQAPLTIEFDASASSDPDGGALEYAWDFGDGSTGAGVAPSHDYSVPGTFQVTLRVTDPEGNFAEAFQTVKSLGAPTAILDTVTKAGAAPFTFRGSAARSSDLDGGSVEYLWEFGLTEGDYVSADTQSVEFVYEEPGVYTMRLSVIDDEGVIDFVEQEISVFATSVESVVIQNGLNDYAGTFEKRISLGGISEMGADVQEYYLDGRPQDSNQINNDTVELIRFDEIEDFVPNNATVVRATLTYHSGTDGNANSDGPYVIGRLATPVDGDTTYADLDTLQDFPEDRGPRSHLTQELVPGKFDVLSGFAAISNLEVVSADVTRFVQDWVSGDVDNEGLAIYTNDTSNGWQLKTIGNDSVDERPKLTIFYATDTVEEWEFFSDESALVAPNTPTQDGELLFNFFLDGGGDLKEALYWFEDPFFDIDFSAERVIDARLEVRTGGVLSFTSSNADSDDPYFVHQVLREWQASPSEDFGANGLSTEDNEITVAVDRFIGMGEEAWTSANVTPILYNWGVLGEDNWGFGVTPGGTDGWEPFWPGIRDENEPRLIIYTETRSDAPASVTGFYQDLTAVSTPMPDVRTWALDGNGDLSLTFVSAEGSTYEVLASENLTDWVVVSSDIAGSAGETSVVIPVGAEMMRFYVLRVQE